MTPRPKSTTLIYDDERLLSLKYGKGSREALKPKLRELLGAKDSERPDAIPDDPLTTALAELMCKFGSDRVAHRARLIDQYVWVPQTKARKANGAKLKWGDSGNYHAWLVIERALQEARRTNPSAKLAGVLRDKFRKLRGKRWCVVWDGTGAERHLYLNDAKQARNRYNAGRRLLSANPALAASARRLLLQLAQKSPGKRG